MASAAVMVLGVVNLFGIEALAAAAAATLVQLTRPRGLWPEGYDLVVLDEVDSTMAEARRRAEASSGRPGSWRASRPTRKGRRGRTWLGGDGNLAATLVYRPWCTPGRRPPRAASWPRTRSSSRWRSSSTGPLWR